MGKYQTSRYLLFVLVVTLDLPNSASGQGDDVTRDLLTEGALQFSNLNYRAADSVARLTLGLPGLRRSQRLQALQLAAAARFPDVEREQYPDSALAALRALVRVAPSAPLPRTLSWRGLDSLLAVARRTTFGSSASVPDSVLVEGVTGIITVDVMATRPAAFILRVTRPGDPSLGELVDSIGPLERGTLRFAPIVTDNPRYPSGTYRMVVSAIEPNGGESIVTAFQMTLQTPPVMLQSVPATLDPATLKPESTKPSRVTSVASGIVIGGFVLASSRVFRAPEMSEAGIEPDSRATGWAIGLGVLTTALSWYLDHGRVIPPNVTFNTAARAEWTSKRDNLVAINTNARIAYRGVAYFALEEQ